MSALPRPIPTLYDQIVEAIHYGAPGAHIEVPEIPQWVDEAGEDMIGTLTEALSDSEDKRRAKLNRLLAACMGNISVDQIVDLRDALRELLADYCIKSAERRLERDGVYDEAEA